MVRFLSTLAISILVVIAPALSVAADSGITVSGAGEVLAKPRRLEIDLQATGGAELSGDALTKYRNSFKRTQDAFTQLKLANLTVEQGGLGFTTALSGGNQMMANNAAGAAAGKAQIDVTRGLKLVLTGVDKLSEEELTDTISRLLDTAKDSGAALSGAGGANGSMLARVYGQQINTSVVTFVVDNIDELREQAYQRAFEQASSRAARLAKLANIKLGTVVSIEEMAEAAAQDDSSLQERMMMSMMGMHSEHPKQDTRVTAEKFADVPVRVALRVRFAIEERTGR